MCRDIKRAFIDYAKQSCCSFCSAVYQTLPRELREMVYEELFPADLDGDPPQIFVSTFIPEAVGTPLTGRSTDLDADPERL